MEDNKKQLMKYFATVLRNLALEKETESLMSKNLVFYFSRKELIEILKKKFDGTIPKKYDLTEMENWELLELIDNELFVISYVTEKWSKETKQEKPASKKTAPSSSRSQQNSKANDKKDTTTTKS